MGLAALVVSTSPKNLEGLTVGQVLRPNRNHILRDVAAISPGEFETSDPLLASFLRCRNFDLLNLRRTKDGNMFFTFLDSPELRLGIVDFVNDGVVPVRSFYSTLRDLESISRHKKPL